jgi:hypothetical protein
MRKSVSARVLGILVLASWASAPPTVAVAHEEHKMECTETSINAMNADIQSMEDGDAKTTATEEMQMAKDMMAGNDIKGCEAHMHNAMEAMEK